MKIKLIFTDYSIDKASFKVTKPFCEASDAENSLIETEMLEAFSKHHIDEMQEYLDMAQQQRDITKKRKSLLKKLKNDFEVENKNEFPEYYL